MATRTRPPGSDEPPGPHGRRGTPAIQRLIEHAPSTGGLALWVAHRDIDPNTGAGTAGGGSSPPGPIATPALTTDGRSLFYAPAFERLTLAQQTGWIAHAVLHVALRHVQRRAELQSTHGDVDAALFNLCADAIVNSALAHLPWLELPAGELRLARLLASALGEDTTDEAALAQWDVERLYRAIDDRAPPTSGGPQRSGREGGQNRGGAGKGERQDAASNGREDASSKPGLDARDGAGAERSEDKRPGASPSPAAAGSTPRSPAPSRADGPRAATARALAVESPADLRAPPDAGAAEGSPLEGEAEAARAWRERLDRAHAQDGRESLLRTLLHDLPRPRTPWTQLLRTRLARALAHEPAVTWARPARSWLANQGRTRDGRRMPFEPGQAGPRRAPRLAVVVDVSGSIDARLLQRFAAEVDALSRQHGAGGVLIAGDDRVRHVEPFHPGRCRWQSLVFEGGGGTDFAPLLAEAGRHRPDIAVVLTDLDGPAGPCPRWPVLWAVPAEHARTVVPFGRIVVMD
jgi:predicted metal-dependent peptidase